MLIKPIIMNRETNICQTRFLLKNGLNPEHVYRYCSSTLLYKMPIGRFKQNIRGENLMLHTRFNSMPIMLI